jgi:hypothetical protein
MSNCLGRANFDMIPIVGHDTISQAAGQ